MIATATSLFEGIEAALDSLPDGSKVELNRVSWKEYDQLLNDVYESRYFKLYYDEGRLVAMTISFEHESIKTLFSHLISILAEELDLPLKGAGSASLKTERKKKGADPDDSYYIENADKIRGLKIINLATDPPPDLIIEVDITSSSINKFSIYAAMGIPEFWRYEEAEMHFYKLAGEEYCEMTYSSHFPFVPATVITEFLALGINQDIPTMNKAFRKWVQANNQ